MEQDDFWSINNEKSYLEAQFEAENNAMPNASLLTIANSPQNMTNEIQLSVDEEAKQLITDDQPLPGYLIHSFITDNDFQLTLDNDPIQYVADGPLPPGIRTNPIYLTPQKQKEFPSTSFTFKYPETLDSGETFNEHFTKEAPTYIRCDYCNDICENKDTKNKHHKLIHKIDTPLYNKLFHCFKVKCGTVFDSQKAFKEHFTKQHPYDAYVRCDYCNLIFQKKYTKDKHVRRIHKIYINKKN